MLTSETQTRMLALGGEAIRVYGSTAQINMAIEECAELIVALRHFCRERTTLASIAGEVADVIIMCAQLSEMLGDAAVEAAVLGKLDRLEERLGLAHPMRIGG